VAHAAAAMGISRDLRLVAPLSGGGPSRTRGSLVSAEAVPTRTKASIERRVVMLRQKRGLGPARIAGICGLQASTVHRVLVRHGLNRLDHLDKMTRARSAATR